MDDNLHTDALGQVGALSSRAVDEVCAASPVTATYVGVDGYDHEWGDLGPDGVARAEELYRQLLAEAERCPVEGPDEALARDVLLDDLRDAVAGWEHLDHLRDLNHLASTHQSVYQAVEMTRGRDDVEQRLHTMDAALTGYRALLWEGVQRGTVVARRQVLSAVAQSRTWAGPEGFATQAADGTLDDAVAAARAAQARHADWLEGVYLPRAAERDAVGPERYQRAVRSYLGCDVDVMDAYRWGWDELGRLSDEMAATCGLVLAGAPPAAAVAHLRSDPGSVAGGVGEFLEQMAAVQQRALDLVDGPQFDVDARLAAIEVRTAPAGGALAPYYTPPSEDLSRPGTVWYPVDGRSRFPLWQEVTTAHHEGVPGHHLQCGTQVLLAGRLSRWHRTLSWRPGSGEGWALYAERLMGELGALEDPAWRAGMLSMQLLRAARVVVDVGLHLELPVPTDNPLGFYPGERWTPRLAREMLTGAAHLDLAESESEVVRYLGLPGQAISYKLGERRILELRDEARRRPGYDQREFHGRVLGAGAVGLDLLAAQVRR